MQKNAIKKFRKIGRRNSQSVKNARNDRNIIMEELLLIAHLAHTEIHLYELIERTNNKKTKKEINKILQQVKNFRIFTMKKSSISNIEVIWCSLKHLLLAYIHCIEIYEKNKKEFYIELSKNVHNRRFNLAK